jgi:AmmeMemoRadiSam system protein A
MGSLTEKEKEILHQIARLSAETSVRGGAVSKIKQEKLTKNIKEKRGAFVTLKRQGKLRGCIGNIIASTPLYITVEKMARAAALDDPRFHPMKESDLDDLEIEISALTPLQKIKNIDQIEVGKHGLYLKSGWSSGLLLPQVPGEYGWDLNTFLEHTCLKANLSPDAWKDPDTEIYIFSAEVF